MTIDPRYQRLPFEEAVNYLADKITLPTDSWRDIRDDEHDAFFVVAGAKGSMLSELREAVETAIRDGQRLEDFQPVFERIAQGWDYNGTAGWRSRIILQTNLRASYGRGREQMQLDPEVLKLQPYLRYIHGGSLNPRPHHIALNGQVFTADTMPWSCPNGYGCTCRYVSLSNRRLEQLGLQPSTIRRGDTMADGLPLEPDPGWDRQPGQARGERRRELIQGVIDRSPPEIAQQIRAATAAYRPPAQPVTVPTSAKSETYEIPKTKDLESYWTLGEGNYGRVVMDRDAGVAIKYNKDGTPLDEQEVRLNRIAGDLGVGPKVVGVRADRTAMAMEVLDDKKYQAFDGASEAIAKLPKTAQRQIASDLVTQLRTLHDAGINHNDFHSENALFDIKARTVRIIDYGLATDDPSRFDPRRDLERLNYWFGGSADIPILNSPAVRQKLNEMVNSSGPPDYDGLLKIISKAK